MSDIHALVAKMTVEEKAALCTGASAWTTTPVNRLNPPELFVSDGPHGLRRVADIHALTSKSLPATCFPTASSLAATWDVDLLFEMGQALAEVALQPGETQTVTISLDSRAFAYYDPPYRQWITEDGQFDILVGASATDMRAQATVTLQSTLQLPCILHKESTIGHWFNDPAGKAILEPMFAELLSSGLLSQDESGQDGMDTLRFLMDLPLRSFLHFQESSLTQPADDTAYLLLAQAHGLKQSA